MKAKEFLREFDITDFPRSEGAWIGLDAHDPPWSKTQLKQMERQGLISFNVSGTGYRLTLKATKLRDA